MFIIRSLFKNMKPQNFYAVHKGHTTGVFLDWDTCKRNVTRFSGAKYKKFPTRAAAEEFVKTGLFAAAAGKAESTFSAKRKYTRSAAAGTSKYPPVKKPRLSEELSDELSKKEMPTVYTDGACSNNQSSNAIAGYGVWWGDGHPMNLSCKLDGKQTNNCAEIAAINAALRQAIDAGYPEVRVCTDSKFVINCITKWSQKWRSNGWIKSNGQKVEHKVELVEMLKSLERVRVDWKHVRGHSGIHGNEMADRLAVAGISK